MDRLVPFPSTRWSVVAGSIDPAGEARRANLDSLFARYWPPVYSFLLRHGARDPDEARDLAQEFFLTVLAGDFLDAFDPSRGRFRTWVCAALQSFVKDRRRAEKAKKRRPDGGLVSLEVLREADGRFDVEDSRSASPDEVFRREWRRTIVELALRRVREAGEKAVLAADLLTRRELVPGPTPSYEDLAREFGIDVPQVCNRLRWAKQKFLEAVRAEVLDQVSSAEDFEREMADLFGG